MTLFVALLLGLSMVAAGTRVGDPARSAALAPGCDLLSGEDGVSGVRASNHEVPSEPPPRLLGEQTEDSEEDDTDDERLEFAHGSRSSLLGRAPIGKIGKIAFGEDSEAAQRAREGHGARGPPRA